MGIIRHTGCRGEIRLYEVGTSKTPKVKCLGCSYRSTDEKAIARVETILAEMELFGKPTYWFHNPRENNRL